MADLTQARVREVLKYDPETGDFHWRVSTNSRAQAGDIAGTMNGCGYRQIRLDNVLNLSHRLAFLYMNGQFPENQVDHINGVRSDNRWINLREVTAQENRKNTGMRKGASNRMMGVSYNIKSGKYMAYINVQKKLKHLGMFHDFFEAACARKAAENRYEFHPNHGRAA